MMVAKAVEVKMREGEGMGREGGRDFLVIDTITGK